MNYINCIIRLFEMPNIEHSNNEIPLTQFNVEIAHARNSQTKTIIKAIMRGEIAYTLRTYYKVNDYVLIEGYVLTDSFTKLSFKTIPKLHIFQIYPFCINTERINLKNIKL